MDSPPDRGISLKITATFVLIGGTAAYGLKEAISSSSTYATGTFGFLLAHGLVGFVYTALRNPPRFIEYIFQRTCLLAQIVPLALLNAEFYALTKFPPPYVYAHLASPIPPTAFLMLGNFEMMNTFFFPVLIGNLTSASYLTLTQQTGLWTGGLVVLHALITFRFGLIADLFRLQDMEVITLGSLFFTLCAMQALKEMKA